MAENLTKEDLKAETDRAVPLSYVGLKALWDKLNKDANGFIDSKEWGRMVGTYTDEMQDLFGGTTEKELGMVFPGADSNSDNKLSWSEFVAAADLSEMRKLFLEVDAKGDGNGKISSKEYGRAVSTLFARMKGGFGGLTKAEVGKKFNMFNLNEDNEITWNEWVTGWWQKTVPTEYLELHKLFETVDKDENGMVSSKEWGTAVSKNKEMMKKYFGGDSMAEVGKNFNKIDLNGDDKLSWVEIVKAADMGSLKKVFFSMDKDGNGAVDKKEWGKQLSKFKEALGEFFSGCSISELGRKFNSIDANDDGRLTWDEIQNAIFMESEKKEEDKEVQDLKDADLVNPETRNRLANLLKKKE